MWNSVGSLLKPGTEHRWLAAGSQMVQQQALRDFAQAMTAFFDPHNSSQAADVA